MNQQNQTVIIGGGSSQALPALVNLLCFPGLGQLIQGRVVAAILWWCAHVLAALSCFILVGFVLWPIVWIACVVDAARYDPMQVHVAGGPNAIKGTKANPILLVFVGLFGFLVLFSVAGIVVVALTPDLGDGDTVARTPSDFVAEQPIDSESDDGDRSDGNQTTGAEPKQITDAELKPAMPSLDKPDLGDKELSNQPVAGPLGAPEDYRLWKDNTGKYSVSARFVFLDGDTLILEKDNGRVARVPLNRLSQEDRDLAERLHQVKEEYWEPGVLLLHFPRQSSQSGNSGFIHPSKLGTPSGGHSIVVDLTDIGYQADKNVAAYGFLKIDEPGEYVFKTYNYYDRNALFVNGRLVCPYRGSQSSGSDPGGGPQRSKERIQLSRGYVPFCIVGYVDARGSIDHVDWAPPSQQSYQKIPKEIVFHDTRLYGRQDAAELWSRILLPPRPAGDGGAP